MPRKQQNSDFIIGVISVVLTVICVVFQIPILRLVFGQVEDSVMRDSETSFLYTALSFPFIGISNAGASVFRAQERILGFLWWFLLFPTA